MTKRWSTDSNAQPSRGRRRRAADLLTSTSRAVPEGFEFVIGIINELLEGAGLPGNFASADAQEIQEQVQEQRRRELFVEGHRMGVLRRLGRITRFTSGSHPYVGDAYGGMECFPLPDTERQGNPNIT